jgi:hypothetical protein
MVGPAPQVRTGAGLLVAPEPLEHAQTADLLVVTALAGSEPAALLDYVGGDASLPVRELIARTRARGATVASACAGTFLLAEAGILDGLRATTTWWLSPPSNAGSASIWPSRSAWPTRPKPSVSASGPCNAPCGAPPERPHPIRSGSENRARSPPAAHDRLVHGSHLPESRLPAPRHPASAPSRTHRQDGISPAWQVIQSRRAGNTGPRYNCARIRMTRRHHGTSTPTATLPSAADPARIGSPATGDSPRVSTVITSLIRGALSRVRDQQRSLSHPAGPGPY